MHSEPSAELRPTPNGRATVAMIAIILLVTVALLAAERRQASAKRLDSVRRSMDVTRTALYAQGSHSALQQYLLSGDPREAERVDQWLKVVDDNTTYLQGERIPAKAKFRLNELNQFQHKWRNEFAGPLMERRRNLDSRKGTLVGLELAYIQANPDQWNDRFVEVMSELLDAMEEPPE